jgi:hypothetical protein
LVSVRGSAFGRAAFLLAGFVARFLEVGLSLISWHLNARTLLFSKFSRDDAESEQSAA